MTDIKPITWEEVRGLAPEFSDITVEKKEFLYEPTVLELVVSPEHANPEERPDVISLTWGKVKFRFALVSESGEAVE